ncbi:hypothetical protein B0F90DRAFT_1716708 [Multifurca ochricompacta]|uniref:Uncharacterized protein n=1 Tax=Multifurca ochricompacta TaxID=376703 RepID=A0AAD4M4L0_9AGAM|nr:hypothetical protein B0F90DRAFT_1716708 [Multifurca ochricompacta]
MSRLLTTKTTLKFMPLAIGILLRHYYEKVKAKNKEGAETEKTFVPLRCEELMYDEAFSITRNILSGITK